MLVAMEAKEEIRSKLNIEDVIGEYVQLKRAGRNFKGLSPFSSEKTASFMVSPEKHIWHDFSSGKGGDVFTFVMEVEGLDFKGALELLARKANVDLSQYFSGDKGLSKKKDRLYAALDLAAKYYQQSLLRNDSALQYVFKKRKLSKQVVGDFRIGYSPQSETALYLALQKRDFTGRELQDAGLVVMRRHGLGDMFRGRMMVPLMDPQGRVVGFTARMVADEPNAPKYINTPQTMLYDKGRHVFGLHLAKDAIRQNDYVVVVEGNLDVVSSHQAGVKNVVATAGTALTEYHLRSLSRFTQNVRLAFDADKAGVAATERAISVASNLGITLTIVTLPGDAKDPDELLQKDVGLWQQAIDTPKDAVEWLLDEYARRYDLASADGKRRATDQALSVVRGIEDPVLREHYIATIARRVDASLEALNAKLVQQPIAEPARPTKHIVPKKTDPNKYAYQDNLLAMAWVHPELRDSLHKSDANEFMGAIRQRIAAYIKGADSTSEADLLQSEEIRVKIDELVFIAEHKYAAMNDKLYFEATDIVKRIKKEYKERLRNALKQEFAQSTDDARRKALSKQIKQLDQDIEKLKN